MGKETVKNTYVLQEDENIGTVQIADEVVAIIASLAATEVEGVSSMAGNITNELMSKVGVNSLTKGVRMDTTFRLPARRYRNVLRMQLKI